MISEQKLFRRLTYDVFSVAFLTGLVKVAGAAKLIVLARYFGSGDSLDAFLIAFLVPSFISDLLAGSIPSAAVPAFLDAWVTGDDDRKLETYAGIFYEAVALLACVSAVVGAASTPLLAVLASGFPPEKLATTRTLLWMMLPLMPLSAIGNVWRSILFMKSRYRMAAISAMVTPLTSLAVLLLPFRATMQALAAATTGGAIAELGILAFAIRSLSVAVFPRWPGKSSFLIETRRQYAAILGGIAVMGTVTLCNQILAARSGSGDISMFNLGTRLINVLVAVGPAAIGIVILPDLARLASGGDWKLLARSLKKYLSVSAVVTLPLVAAAFYFSPTIVRTTLGRHAIPAVEMGEIASIQAFSFFQLPIAVTLTILFRVFSSLKANSTCTRLSLWMLIPSVICCFLFWRAAGLTGIVISTAVSQGCYLLLLAIVAFRRIRNLAASSIADGGRVLCQPSLRRSGLA